MAQPSYFETLEVSGWLPALEGMRAPLKSYDKNDSKNHFISFGVAGDVGFETVVGPNDYDLAKRLCKAGPEHRKWMRQIQVWVKVSLPLYVWSEFDTYKIGTSTNSESTMHTLMKRPLNFDDFDTQYMDDYGHDALVSSIMRLNQLQRMYQECLDEKKELENQKSTHPDWDQTDELAYREKMEYLKEDMRYIFIDMKSLLPASFIQTRYVNLNYETLHNMYHQRKNHRLSQWSKDFVSWIKTLPNSEFITEEWED